MIKWIQEHGFRNTQDLEKTLWVPLSSLPTSWNFHLPSLAQSTHMSLHRQLSQNFLSCSLLTLNIFIWNPNQENLGKFCYLVLSIACLPIFMSSFARLFKWGPLWLFLDIQGQGWFSELVFSTIGHSHFKQTNKKKTHHASSPAQRCSPTIRISLKAFCSPLKISNVDRCKLSIQRLKIPGWEGARGEVLINSSNWLLLHRWCLVYLGNCKGHFTANQLNENLLNPF